MKKFIKKANPGPKPTNLEAKNTRLIMQAFHGCRKNCAECRQAEAEWEPKVEQKEVKYE